MPKLPILLSVLAMCAPLLAQPTTAPANMPDEVLLLANFHGRSDSGLHFAWSADGLKWSPVKNDASFLKPQVGSQKLMRDPCILQGPDGALSWSGEDVRLYEPAPARQGRVARRLGRPAGRRVPLLELAETARAGVLAEFAAAIREGREPETSGRDNLLTLELVFGAVEAAASGRSVRLSPGLFP